MATSRQTTIHSTGQPQRFAAQYAQAREVQYLAIADELLEIADDGRNDWMHRNGNDERVAGN